MVGIKLPGKKFNNIHVRHLLITGTQHSNNNISSKWQCSRTPTTKHLYCSAINTNSNGSICYDDRAEWRASKDHVAQMITLSWPTSCAILSTTAELVLAISLNPSTNSPTVINPLPSSSNLKTSHHCTLQVKGIELSREHTDHHTCET